MSNGMGMQIASMIYDMASESADDIVSNINAGKSLRLQKKSYRTQKDLAYHPYSIAMADLERAGINPLLAVSGGIHTGGMTSAMQGRMPVRQKSTMVEKAAALGRLSLEKRKAGEEVNLLKSQATLNVDKKMTEQALQNMYSNSANKIAAEEKKLGADKKLSEAMAVKALMDAKASSALEGKYRQQALGQLYENYKSEARNWLYKGKKGKFVGFIDWLMGKNKAIPPIILKEFK